MIDEFLVLKDPFDEPKEKKNIFGKQKKKVIGKRLLRAKYRLQKDEHGNAIVHYLARRSLIYNSKFDPFYDVEDFNSVGAFQKLPIHWAAQFGTNSDDITRLFQDTSRKLHQDVKGKNVLELSIMNGDAKTRSRSVKGLISILQKSYSGHTLVNSIYRALAVASKRLHPAENTIKILVEEGILCNKKAENQKKVKNQTLTSNAMFAALRKLGDNLEFEGTNILHLAVKDATEKKTAAEEDVQEGEEEENRFQCVENILTYTPENSKHKILAIQDENRNTSLHIAVGRKDLPCVRIMIKDYSPLLQSDTELANNILVFAAKQSNQEIYDLVLSLVRDQEQVDGEETSHLTDINASYRGALEENNQEMVEYLIEQKNADVNHPIGSKSGLEVATEKGYAKIVDFLLKQKDLNWKEIILKESRSENLFHKAIKSVMPNRILSSLLKYFFLDNTAAGRRLSEESQICQLLTERDGRADTPLHLISKYEETDVKTFKLLLGLYKNHEIDLKKLKNEDGQTPLHLAAKYYRRDFVDILSGHRSFKELVMVEDKLKHTTIQIVSELEKNKEKKVVADEILNILLKSSEATSGSHIHNAARYGAFTYLDNMDQDYLKSVIDNLDLNNQTPLYVAVDNGQNRIVEYLLKNGADVTIKMNEKTALQLAIQKNNRGAIEKFIDSKSWLSALQTGETKKLLGPDLLNTPMRDLIRHYPKLAEKVLNKCYQQKLNLKDNNETSTFIFELLEDTQLYVEEGRSHTHIEEYQKKTKMRKKKIKDNQFEVPYTRFPDAIVINHPLMLIIDYKQKNLLSHRVIKKVINYKWDQFAAIYYYINFLFYVTFLSAFTALVMSSMAQNPVNYPKVFQCSDFFQSEDFSTPNASYVFKPGTRHKNTNTINSIATWIVVIMICFRYLVILVGFELRLLALLVARGVVNIVDFIKFVLHRIWCFIRKSNQFYEASGTSKMNYYILLKQEWALLFDIATYTLALFVADPTNQFGTVIPNEKEDGFFYLKSCQMWQLSAFTVSLAWINLLTYMRQIPYIGTYIIILNDILYTFVSFIIVFGVFVMSFTFGFHLLFHKTKTPNFDTFGYSMLKTVIMMSGEYDYGDIFYGEEPPPFPYMSYITFTVFFILLSIILINLLVGLTVNDVNMFVEIADLKKLSMRLKFILNIEEFQRNNLPQQLLDGLYQIPRIGFIFGPLRTFLGILFVKRTTPREWSRNKSLVNEQNRGKMWKQVITEKVFDDRKQHIMDLKNKTADIEYQIEKRDEQMKKKIDNIHNNFNDRIDRIEEITNAVHTFLTFKNDSAKSKAEKKKTMLRNLHKDFTNYEADYVFNESEKEQRLESLETKMLEMDNKIDQILRLLSRGERVEQQQQQHLHGRDCDERYCSQPGALHI